MKKIFLCSIVFSIMLVFLAIPSFAAPTLYTTDFINDASRDNFNGFEFIPNDGSFYTGGDGPYTEDGITVEQINGDGANSIWVNSSGTYEGNHSWYPNAGDSGYSSITLADGSDFFDIGFWTSTGAPPPGSDFIHYDVLLDGSSVLTGSIPGNDRGVFQYLGFGGGGFDEIHIWDVTNASPGINGLTLDAIETRGAVVPEPSTMLLLGFGLLGLASVTRKKLKK